MDTAHLRYLAQTAVGVDARTGVTASYALRALEATRAWLLENGLITVRADRDVLTLDGRTTLMEARGH